MQEDILELLEQRNPEAVQILMQQYGTYCRSIVMRILSDEQDVSECCNDVWMQVWQHIPPLKPLDLKLYVGKTARNLALHRLEYNNAQKRRAWLSLLKDKPEQINNRRFSQ